MREMSKAVMVCLKTPTPELLAATQRKLARFLETLRPDHLPQATTQIISDGRGLFIGVFNPIGPESLREYGTYVGWMAGSASNWWQPGTPAPDGTFALLRGNADFAEALADFAGTRTLWIGHDADIFVASTSQRAIPWFLGGFEPEHNAVAWMLSSGSLGPGYSWDKRARPLTPASSACLNRLTWTVRIDETPIDFRPDPIPEEVHRARLRDALRQACGGQNIDWSKWVLPLSGGNDCRAILMRIADRRCVRTVTWGLQEALDTPGTDAYVARELAARLGLKHEYLPIDMTHESPQRVLERFLVAGDGRLDHVGGYTDGFELWRRLNRNNVAGIVRGDQPFGRKAVSSYRECPLVVGLARWAEFSDLPSFTELGLEHLGPQEFPRAFARRPDESAPDWRDRLVHAYTIPSVHAALTDLKAGYVEVMNPLQTRKLMQLARSQPAPLRLDKKLFREVAAEESVPVEYASRRAIAETADALSHPAMIELLRDHVSSRAPREALSPTLMDLIQRRMSTRRASHPRIRRESRLRRIVKRLLPKAVRRAIERTPYAQRVSPEMLALRTYLISEMHTRMTRDGQAAY
jgi:hypothetical protein